MYDNLNGADHTKIVHKYAATVARQKICADYRKSYSNEFKVVWNILVAERLVALNEVIQVHVKKTVTCSDCDRGPLQTVTMPA